MTKKNMVVDHNKIETLVWQISEPLVASCNAELIDVEYVKEGPDWYLRLFIDREPPVNHDLCEMVSNLVSDALDKNDPTNQSYYLEISSPGLERPLKRQTDFDRFCGADIVVRLYASHEGKKEFCGRLLGLKDNKIVIDVDGTEISFDLNQVAKTHLKADL